MATPELLIPHIPYAKHRRSHPRQLPLRSLWTRSQQALEKYMALIISTNTCNKNRDRENSEGETSLILYRYAQSQQINQLVHLLFQKYSK